MRKIIAIYLLILITTVSCKNRNPEYSTTNENSSKEKDEKQEIKELPDKKSEQKKIGDYMSDTTDYFWSAKQSDTASYWVRIVFQKEFAVYQFHGQCLYWFFTNHYYTGIDKIELLWSYKTDCLLDMDFLRKSNGIKKYPKMGDVFCEYKLINDTVIEVKYNFPEWIERINKMEKDSIFPEYLYLDNKDGI
ncbi:MAG: hypothetical protein LBV74_06750 [Tannerella sp.]|jgi:hypothetical protein|nr:hypothetical protein [Tannerella sp.]